MDTRQVFFPEFGYIDPIETDEECVNPAFADKFMHKVGVFAKEFHEDALQGYSCIYKCVNCGQQFKHNGEYKSFRLSNKIP